MKKIEGANSKVCFRCKIEKSLDLFHKETKGVLGRQGRCKECHKIAIREYNSRTPEKTWVFNLRRFNILPEEYNQMAEAQNNLCAICNNPETSIDKRINKVKRLSIDHDHSCCGKKSGCKSCNRSLLCQSCNQALGLLKEDYDRIVRLSEYVKNNPRFWH